MKSSVFTTTLFFAIIFCSCNTKEDLRLYIPPQTESLVAIDLPSIKSKALTWENIKKYVLSYSKENTDYSLDLDRKAYICSVNSIQDPIFLIPIKSESDFGKAMQTQFTQKVQQRNGFDFIETSLFDNNIHIAWKKDIAILCANVNSLDQIQKNDKPAQILSQLNNADISGVLGIRPQNNLGYLTLKANFENGYLTLTLDADQALKKEIETDLLNANTPSMQSLSFTTDSCIFGFSANIQTQKLEQILNASMPYLKEYGVIEQWQYKQIKPHLDGRIYFGLSKLKVAQGLVPEAKLVLGTKKSFDSIPNSPFLNRPNAYFQVPNTNNYLLRAANYCIYSNHTESNTLLNAKSSVINLQINREAIGEHFFTLPKIMFGKDAVEAFPLKNIDLDLHQSKNHLVADCIFRCRDQNKNSLLSILEMLEKLQQVDEI